MEGEAFFDREEVTEDVNAEVKRVADSFMFALKYKEQFQASGIEFSDLRQYQTSDDASRIDWKNSAKSQDLFVKEYEEEKDMDVFIILDASDSMLFGSQDSVKAEFASVAAAAIVYASIDNGINAGIGIFSDDELIMFPDGGELQYRKIIREVSNRENYGGPMDMAAALGSVIGQIKDNTAVFVVSDFLNVGDDWKSNMIVASKKFRHVMAVMVRDPRDRRLPDSGVMRLEGMSGKQMVVNTSKIREEFKEEAEKQEQRIISRVEAAGASIITVETTESFAGKFTKHLEESGANW